jgi:glutathione S-transferase
VLQDVAPGGVDRLDIRLSSTMSSSGQWMSGRRLSSRRIGTLKWNKAMSDYDLYYWPVPFRGQFVRAVLAFAGKTWSEGDVGAMSDLMSGSAKKMPVPFMGPPLLIDKKTDFAISQMAAIVLYLGETLNLLPDDAAGRAMTIKIVLDANDVIDEITQDGGREMWTDKRWQQFVPRLQKWMSFWEETGRRHGLKAKSGFLLGGKEPGIADVVTATLWSTMTERFKPIEAMLEETAPMTAALCARISARPELAALAARAREDYGDSYCGGEIEKSLRKVLKA